jgi:monoamine oxidase
MGPQAAVQKFLAQLDDIFGSSQEPKPATSSYVKAHVFDWSQEQWVGGAYSFPSLGAEEGDREALAAPVAGTIFFAGKSIANNVVLLVLGVMINLLLQVLNASA